MTVTGTARKDRLFNFGGVFFIYSKLVWLMDDVRQVVQVWTLNVLFLACAISSMLFADPSYK